ncbi:hypothetical protein P2W68_03790 [Chryseobacterium arthrosphaerae]|uniref:hypothetical protein n=1 Tax=Chryseobacterium arthrosphaerae TaxID=651561 RepID=UPI0023E27151|nr:hypothetical protein [Chryseobacterium arthrosphaerae]WES98737.1 hypothetical protein P2W68_03790 [Chryseobacterium arthrosphaerae]
MILSNYSITFLRSLKKGDVFQVSCSLFADEKGLPRLHFKPKIILNGKLITRAVFTGTCIPSSGGSPYLPTHVQDMLADLPKHGETAV